MRIAITVILVFVLFSSCTMTPQVQGPASYQLGYKNGYESGKNAAGDWYSGWKKDVYRYQYDQLYKQGWDDGFITGKSKQESIDRMFRH